MIDNLAETRKVNPEVRCPKGELLTSIYTHDTEKIVPHILRVEKPDGTNITVTGTSKGQVVVDAESKILYECINSGCLINGCMKKSRQT